MTTRNRTNPWYDDEDRPQEVVHPSDPPPLDEIDDDR